MKKLGVIHTTPVTIDTIKNIAEEIMPDVEIVNIMDDTILPELNENGGDIEAVQPRWENYAKNLEEDGADAIISACSSVGDLILPVQSDVGVPVLRIDEAMANYAIKNATTVGVAATLPTTLQPTMNLLKRKANEAEKNVSFIEKVASDAYNKLMSGDSAGHDEELRKVLDELYEQTDIVVLAQASMARVVETLPKEKQDHFLVSPRSGMEYAKEKLNS